MCANLLKTIVKSMVFSVKMVSCGGFFKCF